MAHVKISELAYIRLQSPDLDIAEAYLTDFGMTRVDRTATKLFMRGTDPKHHLHITELGAPKVLGFGYLATDVQDLARLGGVAAVEAVDEPGGGRRVVLTDPLGFRIEVLADIAALPAIPVTRHDHNLGAQSVRRHGIRYAIPRGASTVKRIGHAVLHSTALPETLRWYRETLGLLATDDVWAGDRDNLIASFSRINRGDEYVDHHVLFVVQAQKSGLNHISFEVQDFDDVIAGHEHLRRVGKYQHAWGVGRHFLGSQIFDYWQDPWGRIHEHWTDTDVLNASEPLGSYPAEIGFGSQWGDAAPEEFVKHSSV